MLFCHPDLNHPSAQFTGRQFSAEELANDISGSENPLKKTETYFRERGPERGLETFVRFVPADDAHPDSLKIKTRCENYDICGYMARGEMHVYFALSRIEYLQGAEKRNFSLSLSNAVLINFTSYFYCIFPDLNQMVHSFC